MKSSVTTDLLLLTAPMVGTAVNILTQLVMVRVERRTRLLIIVVNAFVAGGIVAVAISTVALSTALASLPDALALTASVLIIYSASGLVIFALINLGETSLRIRMLKHIMEASDNLTEAELLSIYNDATIISVRLERIRHNRQAEFSGGVYHARLSFLFLAARAVRLLQRLIFGRQPASP